MLKKFLCLALTSLLVFSVSGCSGSKKDSSASGTAKITLSFAFPGEDDATNNYFNSIGKEYSKQNPNVTIEVTQFPTSATDVETKLNALQLSGDFPDVMSTYLYSIPLRGPKGDYENLNSYINKWDSKSDIYDSALNIGKYKDETVGIGFFPAPNVLAYRKDFFKEAGLDPNNPPKTWSDLEQDAIKLTKRDSAGNVTRAGFDIPTTGAGSFYQAFMWQNGALVVDTKNQTPELNDTKVIDAVKFIKKMADEKVSIPFNYNDKQNMPFMNDKSAMGYIAATQYTSLINKDSSYKDKIGIAPVIQGTQKASFTGYRLFTMSSKSKYKAEAWKFIEFMMSKEQMQARAEKIGIPVVRKSLTDYYSKLNPDVNSKILDYVQYGKGAYIVPWNSMATQDLDLAYEQVMTGNIDATKAYNDAQTKLKQDIQKFQVG